MEQLVRERTVIRGNLSQMVPSEANASGKETIYKMETDISMACVHPSSRCKALCL